MSLYQDFLSIEERMLALLDETRQLSERVAQLERHNQQLQESHMMSSYNRGGLDALHDLYSDGFHVCHAHFAQAREEDCLFCLSLLIKGNREDNEPDEEDE